MSVLVAGILLLETLMTAFTFYTLWTPLTRTDGLEPFSPVPMVPGLIWLFVALAPITGLGEQHIGSNSSAANQQK